MKCQVCRQRNGTPAHFDEDFIGPLCPPCHFDLVRLLRRLLEGVAELAGWTATRWCPWSRRCSRSAVGDLIRGALLSRVRRGVARSPARSTRLRAGEPKGVLPIGSTRQGSPSSVPGPLAGRRQTSRGWPRSRARHTPSPW